ncbi:GNAT family N-acetyltransferase [Deinococcus marmoris]|uniref:GCN5-related N-acetyltransferase n=1 Tax=Deinococcus marmoris TaxID=249408 RepID=A0A1U7NZ49_9DEIO|nr:GNAT family N-acetyltransferase [Deinococcus marmoris]OLV18188.1 GCN5-related N-acetyltransferase [Deinococcus marmoris]
MNDSHEHPPGGGFTLRPFQNADAPAVARLVTDSVRGHWTYLPERFRESADPLRRRLVALAGPEVIATAHLLPFGAATPDALRLDLAGDGAAFTPLYLALLADLPPGFSRLLGVTREDFGEQMAFFGAAGFRNAWQSWGAHLDLGDFDFAAFRSLEERLFLKGYEIEQLSNDAPDADWDALYALHTRGLADAPRNPTTTPEPLTSLQLREMIVREETVFVARLRGQIVALTRLTPCGQELESENTVTHPDHRSRGLATLVKARALAWAAGEGFPAAGTGGTVLNLPMLRVNTRLGYRVERMWVTWERELAQRATLESPPLD